MVLLGINMVYFLWGWYSVHFLKVSLVGQWEDSDTSKEIIDYETTAHVFGGSSSTSCSNFALIKIAMDNEELLTEKTLQQS